MNKKDKCECGQLKSIVSKTCQKCYTLTLKGESHPSFISGKPKCIDCGKIVSSYNVKRCRSCSDKFRYIKKIYCCIECGNQITKNTALFGKGNCSACDDIKRKVYFLGENNPFYNNHNFKGEKSCNYVHGNGYAPYPNIFNKTLKLKIRERDNFTCQCCNLSNKLSIKKFGRSLDIHHIDYHKFNCDISNLITLCLTCNTKANFDKDYWFAYYTHIMENYK